jgi:hypothetical protein
MSRLAKNKKFIIIIALISIIGFGIYWFWPQTSNSVIVDDGQHINQETRKIIEESNAKSKIKTRYIIYNDADVSLPHKAQSLVLDQKQDVFYVLIKPLSDKLFRDIGDTSYVQASPTLETKLIDKHPNLTNIIGPYIYGQNYNEAVVKANEQLHITTRFVEDKDHNNHYDSIIKTLFVIFISLSLVTILLSIFTNGGDDGDSSGGHAALIAANSALTNSVIISNMH